MLLIFFIISFILVYQENINKVEPQNIHLSATTNLDEFDNIYWKNTGIRLVLKWNWEEGRVPKNYPDMRHLVAIVPNNKNLTYPDEIVTIPIDKIVFGADGIRVTQLMDFIGEPLKSKYHNEEKQMFLFPDFLVFTFGDIFDGEVDCIYYYDNNKLNVQELSFDIYYIYSLQSPILKNNKYWGKHIHVPINS